MKIYIFKETTVIRMGQFDSTRLVDQAEWLTKQNGCWCEVFGEKRFHGFDNRRIVVHTLCGLDIIETVRVSDMVHCTKL